ncbi:MULTISPECIES: MFS transporter [unclassified Bradyrhizobium]|uniref:MFS transporter n=1 Tax=unclassified Bradyrhizobium TaxID=2631580 RepID=UPI0024790596|nr:MULTISPECIES: MFS transporter [unclassified Bradyrhizobium]WGS17859.1 MFS transporter [Bradyrhizobium sp. ISRA463]WGS24659.1 MFS transporter [Bradyrhizobium sp. ISRA464]
MTTCDIGRPSDTSRSEPRPWRMWSAAWVVTAVFVLSNPATPLYVYWQRTIGFSSGTLSVIFAAYILGLLATLSLAGQLSDRYGRRPVLMPGLAAAMLACVLFATATTVGALLVARFLSGVAVGAVVSAGMASVVDQGGPNRRRLASLIASVAMVLGAGLGPLFAGSVAVQLAEPVVLIFTTELIVLACTGLLVLALPQKRLDRNPGDGWRLRVPSVPHANRRQVAFGVAIFGPGITATSFVLSLGPSLLSKLLHVTSPLVAGGTACAMFLTATGVQFALRRLPIRTIMLIGAAATVMSMISIAIAVDASLAGLLILAALLAGAGQGLGQLGGLSLIGLHVPAERRAEANAVMNFGGYILAGLLPVLMGYLIDFAGLATGAAIFAAALGLVAAAGAWFVQIHLRE